MVVVTVVDKGEVVGTIGVLVAVVLALFVVEWARIVVTKSFILMPRGSVI
jgi:hypothetical protein